MRLLAAVLLCVVVLWGSPEVSASGPTVNIFCFQYPAEAFSDQACDGSNSNLPWTVPEGYGFCVTHMAMFTKFPWNPAMYGDDMRSLYFVLYSAVGFWVVPAHHPEFKFEPALGPFPSGTVMYASVLNNMSERQNIGARAGGYLSPTIVGCDR